MRLTAPLHSLRLAIAALALAVAMPAAAQMRDAGSDIELAPDRQEELERAVDEARYRLGPFHVAPWIGVRDITYVRGESSSPEGESDLTATAGAGLRFYLPLGEKAMLAAHALPEYSWWQEQDDRNAVIGHYGVGLFGFYNRLQTEVTARSVEEVAFLSSDLLVREPVRSDEGVASAQVRLGGAVALFGSATATRIRVEETDGSPAPGADELLDHDTRELRAGLRYLVRGDRGHVGAGVLDEETEFVDADESRSNEGSSWYVEAGLRGNHLDLALTYDHHELEPTEGSSFPGYDEPGGSAILSIHPGHRMRFSLYGLRELRYSAVDIDSFFEEERLGATVGTSIGGGSLEMFYEVGENRFFGSLAENEDVTAYGALFGYQLGSYLSVRLGGRFTRFETELGGERELRELQGALGLSFGSPPGDW